ncbi:MAG: hypothetical protein DMG05_06015 [Acidobacteria bacterium]|nr:MAG: hypothetical protein DMG05_06015 [Acidobacteriota bacterium]
MVIYKCDLCNQIRECVQKKIDGKYYDVCVDCWSPLEEKLRGKESSALRSLILEFEGVLGFRPVKQFFEMLKRRRDTL